MGCLMGNMKSLMVLVLWLMLSSMGVSGCMHQKVSTSSKIYEQGIGYLEKYQDSDGSPAYRMEWGSFDKARFDSAAIFDYKMASMPVPGIEKAADGWYRASVSIELLETGQPFITGLEPVSHADAFAELVRMYRMQLPSAEALLKQFYAGRVLGNAHTDPERWKIELITPELVFLGNREDGLEYLLTPDAILEKKVAFTESDLAKRELRSGWAMAAVLKLSDLAGGGNKAAMRKLADLFSGDYGVNDLEQAVELAKRADSDLRAIKVTHSSHSAPLWLYSWREELAIADAQVTLTRSGGSLINSGSWKVGDAGKSEKELLQALTDRAVWLVREVKRSAELKVGSGYEAFIVALSSGESIEIDLSRLADYNQPQLITEPIKAYLESMNLPESAIETYIPAPEKPSLMRVGFAADSTAIDAASAVVLDKIAAYYIFYSSHGAQYGIRLEGHSSVQGSSEYNVALSRRLADAVKRYLVDKGIAPEAIDVASFGEEKPLCDQSPDESCQAQNRRVEIEFR